MKSEVKSKARLFAVLAAVMPPLWGVSTPALGSHTSGPPENNREIAGNFNYGVCRGTDPRCYHNWGVQGRKSNRVLVYSRTTGPRHQNLGPRLTAGINRDGVPVVSGGVAGPTLDPGPSGHTAQLALIAWLNAEGISVDVTEDVSRMTSLDSYKAVIFMSPTRDTLWNHELARRADTIPSGGTTPAINTGGMHVDAPRTALRQFMRAGNGFVGIHNAFGTEYNWQYYEGLLGNANYYNHGANQPGDAVVVNVDDVSTKDLPTRWPFIDEWYNLVPFPTEVNFLLTVDEETLKEGRGSTHPGHGNFHPVSWCQYYDGGKVWVTTLGHDRGAFSGTYNVNNVPTPFPSAAEFKKHVVAGIKSVMGLEGVPFCATGKSK